MFLQAIMVGMKTVVAAEPNCHKWHSEGFAYCTAVAFAFKAAFLVSKRTCGMFLTYTAFLLESSSL